MDGLILAAGTGSRIRDIGPSKPLIKLGGMTLLERVMRTMADAGINRIIVVTGYEEAAVAAEARSVAERLGLTLANVSNPDWREANGLSVVAAGPALESERFLLSMCDHIVSPVLMSALCRQQEGEATYLGVDYRLDNPDVDLDDVTRVQTRGGDIVDIGKGLQTYNAYDCGVFSAHRSLILAIEDSANQNSGASLSDGMRALSRRGLAKAYDIDDAFWIDVDDKAAFKRAEIYLEHFHGV